MVAQPAAGDGAQQRLWEFQGTTTSTRRGHSCITRKKQKKGQTGENQKSEICVWEERHEFEFVKGLFVLKEMLHWRKWPRQPAGHCKYRVNAFLWTIYFYLTKITMFPNGCMDIKKNLGYTKNQVVFTLLILVVRRE